MRPTIAKRKRQRTISKVEHWFFVCVWVAAILLFLYQEHQTALVLWVQ